jgi:hypothetical protein
MGRSDQDDLTAAQIFYPCMQCADIFFLKASIYDGIAFHCLKVKFFFLNSLCVCKAFGISILTVFTHINDG